MSSENVMFTELKQAYALVRESYVPRNELLAMLADDDLAFSPGGQNRPLGELCLRLGETQHCYAESFRLFAADFQYRHADPTVAERVARLRAWYETLDSDLDAALSALGEEDRARTVARDGERIPLATHLLVFNEALLLFYGKVFVYLKAMGKGMPNKWGAWVD